MQQDDHNGQQPAQEGKQGLWSLKGPFFAGDRVLWIIIATLMILSMLVVYSATNSKAYAEAGGNTLAYVNKQFFAMVLGLIVILVVHRFNYQFYARFATLAFLAAVGLQLLTFVIGVSRNDAVRAIPLLGLTIQPSDFLKVALTMILARQLARRQMVIDKIDLLPRLFTTRKTKQGKVREFGFLTQRNAITLRTTTIPLLFPMVLTCLLVFSSNFSTAGIVFLSCWIMLFIGRAKLSELARLMALALIAGLLAIVIMDALKIGRGPTWMGRIKSFVGIEKAEAKIADNDSDNIQSHNAKIAIASGAPWGKGPGRSTQRARLSHSYSDFAYAFIIEEYGFEGGLLVLVLYLWLFYRTILIFRKCGTAFPSFLVLGLGLLIFMQAAVNMFVSTGLFIVTGQNLPLISMGGSSVLFISLALGMILGVSRQMQEQTLDKPKGESLLEK